MTGGYFHFDEAAAYERFMGAWSLMAGEDFIGWLAPEAGRRWIDVGCGSGAFSAVIANRAAPAAIEGVDISDVLLAHARERLPAEIARFSHGDAQALPFDEGMFDIAVMALVIFFTEDPAKAVSEMKRVTKPGGMVATYAWDMPGGGFPAEPVRRVLFDMGFMVPEPPAFAVSRMEGLVDLWRDAGLAAIETREIRVERSFSDFEDFWSVMSLGSGIKRALAKLDDDAVKDVQARVKAGLTADAAGRITTQARANAIKARVPR